MKPIREIRSRTVVLPTRDIDTDQIIAARFLTTTSRDGLGKHVFYDLRFHGDGSEKPDFVLNKPEARDCSVLVGGNNFGCGSSREHAPWALLDFGFEAVISSAIADIFCNNALKNGLLAIVVDGHTHQWLLDNPGTDIAIDVTAATVLLANGKRVNFTIDSFAQHCLVEGIDPMGFLRQQLGDIEDFEENRSWTP